MEAIRKPSGTQTNIQRVIIPFELKYNPMKRLALIGFERNPDDVYIGLEPQYFDDDTYGTGYRIIAYRCDGYVDVYDDVHLKDMEDENFDVAGKGLCERRRVAMENTMLQVKDGCVHISFRFKDKKGRPIDVQIIEGTAKKTKRLDLLAPIGHSTENPSYLPLFFLYDFDFVRKHRTDVKLMIDGKTKKLDHFPVPMLKDFQRRYYTRYTTDCQMVELANSTRGILTEHQVGSSGSLEHKSFEYKYNNEILQQIILKSSKRPFVLQFHKGFPDFRSVGDDTKYVDTFKITTEERMGGISGEYSIRRKGNAVEVVLSPSDGWTPVTNSLLTKVLFGKKSIFCHWPKTYRYVQKIDLTSLEFNSYWERIK